MNIQQFQTECNKELIKRSVANNDILKWGKILFPHKFNLPFCNDLHNYFIEIKDYTFTSTLAPRNHSKCIHPETNILGEFGIKKAKDIKKNDIVFSIDKNNKIVKQKVLATLHNQIKKGYSLKTRTGKAIIISDEHRMYTFDGYKKIEDIKVGDYIGSLNCEIDSNFEIDDNELKFISYMIFEGSCTNYGFTTSSKYILEDFKNCCSKLGVVVTPTKNRLIDYRLSAHRTPLVRKILQKYNIYNQTSKEKRLPNDFFKMSMRSNLDTKK